MRKMEANLSTTALRLRTTLFWMLGLCVPPEAENRAMLILERKLGETQQEVDALKQGDIE